jgi:PAS domain S-box-containing protein
MHRRFVPLRVLLVAVFMLQSIGAVGLTVWLSLTREKQSIAEMNQRLQNDTFDRIRDRIDRYLEASTFINSQNAQDLVNHDLSLEQSARLTRRFWQQRRSGDATTVTAIYFGSADGRFSGLGFQADRTWQVSRVDETTSRRFYSYAVNKKGNATRLLNRGRAYDPRVRPWYQQAVRAQTSIWSAVYEDFKERRLKLTLSQPVYTERHQLLGVVGVDFTLEQIGAYLKTLLDQNLSALMIVDRSGQVISTSTQDAPYLLTSGILRRLDVAALKDPALSAVAPTLKPMLQQHQGQLMTQTITVRGRSQSLWVAPLRDRQNLDLWIVAVAPTPGFFETLPPHSYKALLLCLAVLMTAILLSLVTARKLSQGLQRMIRGGQAIAEGHFDHRFPNSFIRELGQLSETFNGMANRLRESFGELEERVQERTAALRQSEEKFSKVFYQDPNPAAISRMRDGRFTEVNESTLQLLGFEREEIVGHTSLELNIGVNPGDRQILVESIRVNGPLRAKERQIRHKSGEIKTILYSADLIDLDDEPHLISLMVEITDRKKIEEALRCSEEKFAKIFHTSPNPMTISRMADGYCLEANASAVQFFGADLDEIVGKTSSELRLWVDPTERGQVIAELKANQVVRSRECRLRTGTDDIRTVLLSAELIELEHQPYLICTVHDISDRRQAEEALRQAKLDAERANSAKSVFLANMSHELRTPLNAILGFAQILYRDSTLASEQREHVDIINRSGEHLLEMINNVLNIAKIEAGRAEMNASSFDLDRCLNDLERMFSIKTASKGLSLVFKKSATVPQFVTTDAGKLRQILINLLGNAVKFTEAGYVHLTVSVERGHKNPDQDEQSDCLADPSGFQPDFLHLEVEDTGPGIAADELSSIFETFVQSKQDLDYPVGTGLGLPISRDFARTLGGNITVQSALGQGTTFYVRIPIERDSTPEHQERSARQILRLAPNQSYRLLVADDRWESRQLMACLLKPLGFEVRDAKNGKEAVAIWESWRPHLIWMDMRMPVMDGYEATQRIKVQPQGSDTVIIALTASVLDEERHGILAVGCDGFVQKPFREATIFEVLEHHLGVQFEVDDVGKSAAETIKMSQDSHKLMPSHFKDLPIEWILQVHHAAQTANNVELTKLIVRLPETHHTLMGMLSHLVQNFRCDTIFQVTEQLL